MFFHSVPMIRVFAFTLACSMLGNNVQASSIYEFVHLGSGDILAYWELEELPASYPEVVGLTFTPEGETIFGLGEQYLSAFDTIVAGDAIDDGMDGLADEGNHVFGGAILDTDPPGTALVPGSTGVSFSLRYADDPGADQIWYQYLSPAVPGTQSIREYGDWRLSDIPEPSSLILAAFGVVGILVRRRC